MDHEQVFEAGMSAGYHDADFGRLRRHACRRADHCPGPDRRAGRRADRGSSANRGRRTGEASGCSAQIGRQAAHGHVR